jgi:TonB-linked SusC/RagA family outer membrane protein
MSNFFTKKTIFKIMKISLVQLMLITLVVSVSYAHRSYGQESLKERATISIKNGSLKSVLQAIEKQVDVTFSYQKEVLNTTDKINIELKNETVAEILKKVLTPHNISYQVFRNNQIVLTKNVGLGNLESLKKEPINDVKSEEAIADITIKGTVTDESGEKLPGVSITLKGTTRGVTTNTSGEYSIAVPNDKAVLVFSFVGYMAQEVIVGNRTNINIALKVDNKALDEVVVVGYGTQSRRNVTGSVAKVDMKQMEGLPNTNIAQALRGRVAGVQFTDNGRPGQGGNILIRGQRSISAGNNPLIILDGIFFEGSLNDINPGDVESMEVLKDASATAIYGARAANGVILISSKKGTTEKPTIRFNTYYGVSDWSYKPKLLSPERYVQKTLDWRSQSGLAADPTKIESYLTASEAKNYAAGNTVDPWKEVSQTAGIQNYDLSVSGKSGRTNYFISGNYNNEKGLVYNDNASRASVRINLDNQITDWLKIGVNAQYAERDFSGNEANMESAYWTSPYNKVWLDDAKTDPNPLPNEDGLVGSIHFNAIINKNQEIQRNLFANFYGVVDVPFIKGLSYRINYSPNYRWYNLDNFSPIYQRNNLNSLGNASRRSDFNKTWVLENILTYSKQIGQNHNFDVTLLYGRNQAFNQSLTGSGSDFSGSSDANGWNNLSLAKIQTASTSASNIDAISSMARLNYRYKNRYLLTLTARRDGNSVFGANNKFGTFPSAAVAWIASDESFMKALPAINLLKFRASYGSVGNQAISAYQSLTRQGQVQYVYGDGGVTSTGLFPANLANSNLGWETTTTTNFAVDFEVLKSKIGGTIEYYYMDTKDLLLTRQLPGPTGFSSILTNIGATNNKGIEVTINTVNIQKGKLEWTSNIAFSTNKNKIVHLYRTDANNDGVEDNDLGNRWFIGQPISVAFDYRLDGVYQVGDQIPTGQKAGFFRMQDANGDGKIDVNDRQVLGTLQPKYRWSLTNNFKYGQFNLMVTLNALQGWMNNNNLLALDNAGGGNGAGNFPGRAANMLDADWWTPENKSNIRSSLVYTNPYGHAYYQNRDFVRIQEVSLSYDFPRSMINHLKMSSLKAFVSGRNLYTFTNWQAMDPESGQGSRGAFPTPRTISAGLNLSF